MQLFTILLLPSAKHRCFGSCTVRRICCRFNTLRFAIIPPNSPSHHFQSRDRLLTLCRLVPLPGGGEVSAALAADEGGGHGRRHRVQVQNPVDAFLQPRQVNELRVCRVRDEMHFRRGRFWRWDLEKASD